MNEEKMQEMAKVARLACVEAKNAIMEWSERFDGDEDKIAVAIIASTHVAKDMIDAALKLDDEGIKIKTLRQIDTTLMPLIEKLRQNLATPETKH